MDVEIESIEKQKHEDTRTEFHRLIDEAFDKNYKVALVRVTDAPCNCGVKGCDGTALRSEYYQTAFDIAEMEMAIRCLARAYEDLSPKNPATLN